MLLPRFLSALALAGFGGLAWAQVPLSGPLSDATTGPLLSGVVYHAVADISVPAGATLTAQQGAIVKFQPAGSGFAIAGRLVVNGSASRPVVFTDIQDDSAGGDTNGNGPSVGTPGHWRGLAFVTTADGSQLTRAVVRFAGSSFWPGIWLDQADVTLTGCTVERCFDEGLDLNGTTVGASVSGCTFRDNGAYAVNNVPLQAVPGFASNTATGNGWNYMRVTVGSLASDLTIQAQSCLQGALVLDVTATVPVGRTLTLGPGVVVKLRSASLQIVVNGTLLTLGTAASPVVFTAWADDDWGGDTNNNGPSSGSPAAWLGLAFTSASDASSLDHAIVRYAGTGFWPGIWLDQADVSLTGCTVERCYDEGLDLNGTTVGASVSGCTFRDNGSYAVNNVPLQAVPGFASNTATGNGWNYMRVTVGSMASDLTIQAQSCLQGALVLDVTATVPVGRTLTLGPGVVLKLRSGGLQVVVDGTLVTLGTAATPVVLTAWADDEHGGDTNNDGPSVGAPAAWRGLAFTAASDASALDHAVVRYAGNSYWPGIWLDQADVALTGCTVERCYDEGLDLNGTTTGATVSGCSFRDNGSYAVNNVPLQAVPGFDDNVASGNGGDYLFVTVGTPQTDLTVGPQSCLGGALVLNDHLVAPVGLRLTLQAGVVAKLRNSSLQVNVLGALDLAGTAAAPVVLTEFRDDAWGGDTNGDGGATQPAPGWWRGVYVDPGASASTFRHALVRFSGANYWPGVQMHSALLVAEDLRVDRSYDVGLLADAHAGTAERWTAWGCGGVGISLAGGSFGLRQASAVANLRGISRAGAWSGTAVDSIAWANTNANYVNFSSGQLRYSDGSPTLAGSNGNINSDPLFVDQAQGVLELQSASPCIDTGDPLSPLDPDGSRADMGAWPFNHCGPSAYCTPKTTSGGCVPTLSSAGVPSATAGSGFTVTTSQVEPGNVGICFYGQKGPASTPFQGGWLCVQSPSMRTPPQNSGGAAPCSGVYSIDFNAYVASGADPTLSAGSQVWLQTWFRDPPDPVSGTGLSAGIHFQLCP